MESHLDKRKSCGEGGTKSFSIQFVEVVLGANWDDQRTIVFGEYLPIMGPTVLYFLSFFQRPEFVQEFGPFSRQVLVDEHSRHGGTQILGFFLDVGLVTV